MDMQAFPSYSRMVSYHPNKQLPSLSKSPLLSVVPLSHRPTPHFTLQVAPTKQPQTQQGGSVILPTDMAQRSQMLAQQLRYSSENVDENRSLHKATGVINGLESGMPFLKS